MVSRTVRIDLQCYFSLEIQKDEYMKGDKHMLFVEYPKCTTCQRAKKWLDERGVEYTDRHIKEENPTVEELKEWHKKSGLPLKRFFNTSGMKYRELGLKDKLPEMSEEEQYELLATDGMLVKRPLVVGDDFVLIGFKEAPVSYTHLTLRRRLRCRSRWSPYH